MSEPPGDMPPRWRDWYAGLAEDKRAELMAAWDAAVSVADIEVQHRNSAYARKRLLLEQSAEVGY